MSLQVSESGSGDRRPTFWDRVFFDFIKDRSRRHPVTAVIVIGILSSVLGSVFNILYNGWLIVEPQMPDKPQRDWLFWTLGLSVGNGVIYTGCVLIAVRVMAPLWRTHPKVLAAFRARRAPEETEELRRCQRLLLQLPIHVLWILSLGWLCGSIFFPTLLCTLGDVRSVSAVWGQFLISFFVCTLLTVASGFFIVEEFLIRMLYPLYFQSTRPADVEAVKVSFYSRLVILWAAVAFGPVLAMLVIVMNVGFPHAEQNVKWVSGVVFAFAAVWGFLIFNLVGRALWRWLRAHNAAADRIAREVFDEPIKEKRPDEWGKLTDRVNDMAAQLGEAKLAWETFGQIVHPKVRNTIVRQYPAGRLGGEVRIITVLFADIRGFTRRSAGAPPEQVVALLNRFLSLTVSAIESRGGLVAKFLGDGVMAIFNAPEVLDRHADVALGAALAMLDELDVLNGVLGRQGVEPLRVGIGIHTGPALVGCVGATVLLPEGQSATRREYTAIGETVNLAQRLEQMTKTLGGPVLISAGAQAHLDAPVPMHCLGPQAVPGYEGTLVVYQVERQPAGSDGTPPGTPGGTVG